MGLDQSKAYARLRGLKRLGLVRHETDVPGPSVFLATREGLAVAGCDLSPATVSLATLYHDLAICDVASQIERGAPYARVISEREMRLADHGAEEPCYAIEVELGRSSRSRHLPDLCVEWEGGPIAVEVELSQKRAERTRAILEGYRSARRLLGVIYLTRDRRQARGLEDLAERLHLGWRFQARPVGEDPVDALWQIGEAQRREQEQREAERRRRQEAEERRLFAEAERVFEDVAASPSRPARSRRSPSTSARMRSQSSSACAQSAESFRPFGPARTSRRARPSRQSSQTGSGGACGDSVSWSLEASRTDARNPAPILIAAPPCRPSDRLTGAPSGHGRRIGLGAPSEWSGLPRCPPTPPPPR